MCIIWLMRLKTVQKFFGVKRIKRYFTCWHKESVFSSFSLCWIHNPSVCSSNQLQQRCLFVKHVKVLRCDLSANHSVCSVLHRPLFTETFHLSVFFYLLSTVQHYPSAPTPFSSPALLQLMDRARHRQGWRFHSFHVFIKCFWQPENSWILISILQKPAESHTAGVRRKTVP